MDLLSLLVAAVLALIAFGYVQRRLPHHVRTAGEALAVRLLLAATGIGLGAIGAWSYAEVGGLLPWIAFVVGFGVAHVPAAFILFIKRERGEYE